MNQIMYLEGRGGLPQSDRLGGGVVPQGTLIQGDAQALTSRVACGHGWGGLPQSDALAVEWYRKAADQGYARRSTISGSCTRAEGWVASE